MSYVYRYIHPDDPWLYVGRTENLKSRIGQHDFSKSDNINRQYEEMLKEASVYYIKLKNKAQSMAVESYLIDKYKPTLNKMGIYNDSNDDDSVCNIEIKIPKWIKFIRNHEISIFNNTNRFNTFNSELEQKYKQLKNDYNILQNKYDDIANKDTSSVNYKIKNSNNNFQLSVKSPDIVLDENDVVKYSVEEIFKIFEINPESDLVFKIYSCNHNGEYIEHIVDKSTFPKKSDYDSDYLYECSKLSVQCNIIRYVTDVNFYYGSYLGLYFLKEYYLNELNQLSIDMEEYNREWTIDEVLNQNTDLVFRSNNENFDIRIWINDVPTISDEHTTYFCEGIDIRPSKYVSKEESVYISTGSVNHIDNKEEWERDLLTTIKKLKSNKYKNVTYRKNVNNYYEYEKIKTTLADIEHRINLK